MYIYIKKDFLTVAKHEFGNIIKTRKANRHVSNMPCPQKCVSFFFIILTQFR